MQAIWNDFGFYFWALTTALVVIALAWLAWLTFAGGAAEAEPAESPLPTPADTLADLNEQVQALTEAAPLMRATLGRSLQYCGLVRYPDGAGAQAFSLAVFNARGDGFVLTSSVRGGLNAKPLTAWASAHALSAEEQTALDEARGQTEIEKRA
jgi:hypothetical protein